MFTRNIARSATRAFSTTPVARKSLTESVKETADVVNKKVGKGLADAIETTEKGAHAAKESLGVGAKESKRKIDQAAETTKAKADVAAAKTSEKTTQAKHKADDVGKKY